MPSRPRKIVSWMLLLALGTGTSAVLGWGKKKDRRPDFEMGEEKRALHALNRLTFGPRPGEVARVAAMGIERWIDLQLHPAKLDDQALEAQLASLRTLRMDTKEIVENFPPPQRIKDVAEGKQGLPRHPALRAVYQAQLERYQEKQEGKQPTTNRADQGGNGDAAGNSSDRNRTVNSAHDPQARRREAALYADLQAQQVLDLPPDERMKVILQMAPDEQRALAKRPNKDLLMKGMSVEQKETVMALNDPLEVVSQELIEAKLLRAIYSERQLEEVMTDFWLNHFNVFIGKGADRYLLTSYERDAIRPHALGKFADLVMATAKSPAMLFYLDNWLSVGPNSDLALGVRRPRRRAGSSHRSPPAPRRPQTTNQRRRGLNENYGRELMELHTLGVNGGYTQHDVTEVARVFTGWTIEQPKNGGAFKFEPRMHEPGTKVVLGHKIKENGEREGREVLSLLAHHPSTAHFISTKLAIRFVSDNPPQLLVEHMAETFRKTDGDIREVLRTMFRSPEFWAPEAYRAKIKTPLEFVVSAVRAMGADVEDATPLARTLSNMGMALYGMQPPTGYSMKAETWVNSSALLSRMNFALALGSGHLKGLTVDPDQRLGTNPQADAKGTLTLLEGRLLDGDLSNQTHETIMKQLDDPQIAQRKLDDPSRSPNVGAIAGLILGSPEFQRR